MTLTNYWWLLLWLVLVGGLLSVVMPREPVRVLGKTEYRWGWLPALILACPYVIWAGFRTYFGDTMAYRSWFHAISSVGEEFQVVLSGGAKDPGFSILSALIKGLIGDQTTLFFLLIAAFQMYCVVHFFRRYSTDFLLCMLMFVLSTDYLSWMLNGMRQFIAVCIILLGFGLVFRRKYKLAVLVILLAAIIHASALMMLPIIFFIQGRAWNWKMLLMLVCVGAAILLIDPFTALLDSALADTQYSGIITDEIWTNDDGTNILRALFYSIPAILSLVGKRYIDRDAPPEVNLCVNCGVCTAAIYFLSVFSSGIYVGRLPIYTTLQGYAAVPWIIEHTFTKSSAKVITGGLVLGFLAFFYYQAHAWGLL